MAFRDDVAMIRVLFLLMVVSAACAKEKAKAGKEGPYDITKLGASPDGKKDSTDAIEEAWASACGGTGPQTIIIPKGDFLVGPLNFTGPCTGDVTFQLDGNLLGSNDLAKYKANWIEIMRVHNLVIAGKGTLDGQGKAVWEKNICAKKYDCKVLPNTLVFDFCNNTRIEGITLLNAKFFHLNIYESHGVIIKDVTISAPGDSPNTDGIHMGDSSNITITDTTIGTGDDCISMGPGTSDVLISNITCGPGHGIRSPTPSNF